MANQKVKHKGRFRQVPIYLGKFFRMFIYMNDWKVLPMSAVIALLVALVAAQNMFLTMEGTIFGALALSCICVWNGFFNSIQVVCRERDIVKREHRDGMHITSYICAHVIYQSFLCLAQTVITIFVCRAAGLHFPTQGFITSSFNLDIGITIFLATFSSDMMSLMISCIAKNTTSAMTIMPFMLIFELLFSGPMFELTGFAAKCKDLSIAKWAINCLCAQANYNAQPMVSIWNQAKKFQGIEFQGTYPVQEIMTYLANNGYANDITLWMGKNNQIAEYAQTYNNIFTCWFCMVGFAALFITLSVLLLKRVDHDKR